MNAAERFAVLHVGPDVLILPNAWDVASALLLESAGFAAVGTTSLGVTAAAGLPDGAAAGRDLTVALAASLVARLRVPLTVDLEGGYSDDPAEVAALVRELADLGVAGVNLEDGRPTSASGTSASGTSAPGTFASGTTGAAAGALREVGHHAAVVSAAVAAAPGLFVNARTDAYWLGVERAFEVARARVAAYRDAGASGVFVPGLTDPGEISAVAATARVPLNVLAGAGAPADLRAAGVARVSTGSALYRAALAAAAAAAEAVRAGGALPPSISYEGVQGLIGGRPEFRASTDA